MAPETGQGMYFGYSTSSGEFRRTFTSPPPPWEYHAVIQIDVSDVLAKAHQIVLEGEERLAQEITEACEAYYKKDRELAAVWRPTEPEV
jgi:hypothetical protein